VEAELPWVLHAELPSALPPSACPVVECESVECLHPRLSGERI
jgi:hypothetical protein